MGVILGRADSWGEYPAGILGAFPGVSGGIHFFCFFLDERPRDDDFVFPSNPKAKVVEEFASVVKPSVLSRYV